MRLRRFRAAREMGYGDALALLLSAFPRMKLKALCISGLALVFVAIPFFSKGTTAAEEDHTALEIGRAILLVDQALHYELADRPSPEQVATAELLTKETVRIGQITQLYPWVSARLVSEI